MNGQVFTLQIRIYSNTPGSQEARLAWDPARAGCRTEAIAALPLSFIGFCSALWYRSLWLDSAFWEKYPKPNAPPSEIHSNTASPTWIDIHLIDPDQHAIFQIAGPVDLHFLKHRGGYQFPKKLVFSIADGLLSVPPFYIRLPPNLQFNLTHETSKKLHLDLTHPLLGSLFGARIQHSQYKTTKELTPC